MVPLPRVGLRPIAASFVLAATVLAAPAARAVVPPAVRGEHAMVVSPEPLATEAGVEILRRGGNAVDAAAAVAAALAVTYPRAGNLGGGGFLLYRAPDGTFGALDFRETAPAALTPDLFLDASGKPRPGATLRGGLAVGVPGSVAGLADAHRRWGKLAWKDVLAPAIRLAERGVPLTRAKVAYLGEAVEDLAADPAARVVFTRDGALPVEGDRLVQRDLAATLRRIARDGPDGFYRGPVAEALVRAVRDRGGVMTLDDLAGYRAVLREPLRGRYRGATVVSFPPPSSGGVALLQILGMLERFDLRASGYGSSLTVHRMVEAERRAYADRARWLGDPDFYPVPVAGLLDRSYLARRSGSIRDDRATPSSEVAAGDPAAPEPADTLHLSIAAPDGGVVALTTTLNSAFGARVVAAGTGVLLNNEIDDFAVAPGVPNQFGLVGGAANAIAGGKRPLSSMTPTIVERAVPGGGSRPILVLGSPGGSTIITTVLQVVVDVLDHGLPLQEAVDAPRFHHQWLPDVVFHEARAFPADVAEALRARGHALESRPPIGMVAAIGVSDDGAWLGAADPRGEGTAGGF